MMNAEHLQMTSGTHGLSLLLPVGEKGGMRGLGRCDKDSCGSGGAVRKHRNPLSPPSPLRGEGVKRRAHLTARRVHALACKGESLPSGYDPRVHPRSGSGGGPATNTEF